MTAPNLEYPPRLAYIIFSLIRIDGSNKNIFIIIMWTKRDKTKPVLVLVDPNFCSNITRERWDGTNKTEFLKGMKMMKC